MWRKVFGSGRQFHQSAVQVQRKHRGNLLTTFLGRTCFTFHSSRFPKCTGVRKLSDNQTEKTENVSVLSYSILMEAKQNPYFIRISD